MRAGSSQTPRCHDDAGRVDDVRRRREQTGHVTYAKGEGRS
jgi:hypothetical protein